MQPGQGELSWFLCVTCCSCFLSVTCNAESLYYVSVVANFLPEASHYGLKITLLRFVVEALPRVLPSYLSRRADYLSISRALNFTRQAITINGIIF